MRDSQSVTKETQAFAVHYSDCLYIHLIDFTEWHFTLTNDVCCICPDCIKNVKSIHTIKKSVYMKRNFNTPDTICFNKQQHKRPTWIYKEKILNLQVFKKILKFICGQNICKIIMAVKTDSARSPSFFPNNKSLTQKEVVPVSWATRQKNSTCIIYRYQKSGEYSRTSIDWAKVLKYYKAYLIRADQRY